VQSARWSLNVPSRCVHAEDSVVSEFAALALLSLASYISCRRIVHENKGLEPLIRCLGSNNADLQKNSIDTMSLLLQVILCCFYFLLDVHILV
jgi:hypothetical protein